MVQETHCASGLPEYQPAQDLSGFDSRDTRSLRGGRSLAVEAGRGQAPNASPSSRSPEPGPLKSGMLSLPSRKVSTSKLPGSARQREGLQEIDIDEEQVTPFCLGNIHFIDTGRASSDRQAANAPTPCHSA